MMLKIKITKLNCLSFLIRGHLIRINRPTSATGTSPANGVFAVCKNIEMRAHTNRRYLCEFALWLSVAVVHLSQRVFRAIWSNGSIEVALIIRAHKMQTHTPSATAFHPAQLDACLSLAISLTSTMWLDLLVNCIRWPAGRGVQKSRQSSCGACLPWTLFSWG